MVVSFSERQIYVYTFSNKHVKKLFESKKLDHKRYKGKNVKKVKTNLRWITNSLWQEVSSKSWSTAIDSLTYEIKTNDVYEDFYKENGRFGFIK